MEIELGGLVPGDDHDVFVVTDDAVLGGTLEIILIDDFIPELGDTFQVMTANGISGEFGKIELVAFPAELGVEVVYAADSVSLPITASCDLCDTNCDGSVDLTDVEPFILLLLGGDPCAECTGDTTGDGSVDLTDVEGFIACLLG